jgi:hypothetical protein
MRTYETLVLGQRVDAATWNTFPHCAMSGHLLSLSEILSDR